VVLGGGGDGGSWILLVFTCAGILNRVLRTPYVNVMW